MISGLVDEEFFVGYSVVGYFIIYFCYSTHKNQTTYFLLEFLFFPILTL